MSDPPTLSLIFPSASTGLSSTLSSIRRSTLGIQNRLRSILEDAAFVEKVAAAYGRPIVANERCGSWYVNPARKVGSAYFKSTDGHMGVWSFSLRRLNLGLLEIVGKADSCVIVDSTRRGKSVFFLTVLKKSDMAN
jgi:tRNA A64-2'-O-ribosylphosphate transferase